MQTTNRAKAIEEILPLFPCDWNYSPRMVNRHKKQIDPICEKYGVKYENVKRIICAL
jgi:hypothetical protein